MIILKTIEYKNIIWKKYHGALIPNTAPNIEINLTKEESEELLKKTNAYFLRYTNNWDTKNKSEFWFVIKDGKEDIDFYKSKIRNQIKKGLKNCIVKKVSCEEIAKYGYEVYKKAFDNYNTTLTIASQDKFYKDTLKNIHYDYFAVYSILENGNEEKMIAYSSNLIEGNSCNYKTIKFDPDYLSLYPSYALIHEMNKYYLNELSLDFVNDGARSISHDTNIQSYLIQKFDFRKAFCKLNIIYRWDIELLIKILFPFKNIIKKCNNKITNKLSVLLLQEEIKRSYE